jgi:hypothetical protein
LKKAGDKGALGGAVEADGMAVEADEAIGGVKGGEV